MKKSELKQWIITILFRDGDKMKYVINREHFWQAKEEANEIKAEWSDVKDFSIQEGNVKTSR